MTINISQLRERLTAEPGFSAIEQVSDSIIRSIRKLDESPFAVCYFDIAQNLPETQEKLTKYQDRVIGTRYFEGRKSLQWSNYLYFVTSRDRLATREISYAKELIERDRSYARKFVISEDELDLLFIPFVSASVKNDSNTSILSVWTDQLVEAGLDEAVLSDHDLPTRLKLIESSSSRASAAKPQRQKRPLKTSTEPPISSLQLKKFRNFPLQRTFEFGTVNLIVGANGSGKTSLLEAIELLYCGRNKRNRTRRLCTS
jgi:DNA repair protein SbcC/Rad50